MTHLDTCPICKGRGAVRLSSNRERFLPADSIREPGAQICDNCDGEGFMPPESDEAAIEHIKEAVADYEQLRASKKKATRPQNYPSWMEDNEED